MRVLPDQSPESFGDYLCLKDAANVIGTAHFAEWRQTDIEQVKRARESTDDVEGWERAATVRNRIIEWLVGGRLKAFGVDQDGSYAELDRNRLSKPFFAIDIPGSQFVWHPGEWATIYIGKTSLTDLLRTLGVSVARKTITFEWQEVSSIAWKLALNDPDLRDRSKLISAVQDRYAQEHDKHPDEKELRELARDIIEFLGDRTLSRDETK